MITKLFKNARIVTPSDPGKPLAGDDQGHVRLFEKGALVCRDGIIEAIGSEHEILSARPAQKLNVEVDCAGRCLIPGFVDPHTHMCFAERREQEFVQRIEGMDYLEILRRGGGILSSVQAVRASPEDKLFSVAHRHALSALGFGTTTLEVKSGYGLDTNTEMKMLRVIERLNRETPLDVVPTFLGAHAVPPEYARTPEKYVDMLAQEMIPKVSAQGIARFCDVFCETGAFTLEQSRRILTHAREAGMDLKIHADEVHDLGGAGLAAELGAVSAEHLLAANEENLAAMAAKGVIAVLLPATAYSLRKVYAPARKMIDIGLPVALATDCNPGSSYTESMPFVFGLAVLNMNLSAHEALTASTLNAAYAVGMAETVGSLEPGKNADFLLLDGEGPAVLAYHAGVSAVQAVYKRGELVFAQ
ncbi:MAG: imidazolonepropionase [Thermodesulfobacteriota bacterium]